MSGEEDSARIIATRNRPVFVKRKHSLDIIHKELDKASREAIVVLLTTMESTKDEKLRVMCADKLLAYKIEVAKEISSDQMQRLLAEIKFGRPVGNLTTDPEENTRAIIDFDTVQ